MIEVLILEILLNLVVKIIFLIVEAFKNLKEFF